MTNGIILDDLGWVTDPLISQNTGHRYRKQWDGGNDPPLPILPKRPPSYIYRAYLNDINNVRKIRVGTGPRPRRQKRHVDRHQYTMSLDRRVNSRWDFLCPTAGSGTFRVSAASYLVSTPSPDTLVDANFQLQLLGKLKEACNGSDFNLAIFLGEGHESLEMVADSAIRIAKSIRHIRKGDVAGAARSLLEGTSRHPLRPYRSMSPLLHTSEQAVYRSWLELTYGWRPLLQDVEGGMQYVAHAIEVPPKKVITVNAGRKLQMSRSSNLCGANVTAFSTASLSYRRKLTAVMATKPQTQAQKLGLLDPLSLAWELLPFSFVVDWFIPVGQFLNANGFVPGLTQEAWITNLSSTDVKIVSTTGSSGGPCFIKATNLTRTPQGTTFPVPFPNVKPFGKAASWQHAANAVALLGAMFRG